MNMFFYLVLNMSAMFCYPRVSCELEMHQFFLLELEDINDSLSFVGIL